MKELQLVPAERMSHADRAALLNAAYIDYAAPMHLTAETMQGLVRFYDVDLAASVVALAGSEPVGMALLSCRGERGWISGVGVLPAWRRQGIARRMMEAVLARPGEGCIREIALEVITQNLPARALYASLGFAEGRELLAWRFPADADPLPIPEEQLSPAPVEALLAFFDGWHDQPPCWQAEAATLRKMTERMRGYRLDLAGIPAGYCLVGERDDAVALMDVGIAPDAGMLTAGRTLLQALAARYRGRAFSINNVPVDSGLNRVLAALRFLVAVRQVEMRLKVADPCVSR
jgi:ribosomal protein S18 acetylase RimI-like enzyme